MYSKTILFIVFLTIISIQYANSRSRKGGGRYVYGTGPEVITRSRTKSRAIGTIDTSSRYPRWALSHGFSASFRYRTSSYEFKRHGIQTGMIVVSSDFRENFMMYNQSYHNDISICYNEFSIYGTETTTTPWFVCPWYGSRRKYCCGGELDEDCCEFFDRPAYLAGLLVGSLVAFIIFSAALYYWYRRSKKPSVTMISMEPDKDENIGQAPALGYPEINQDQGHPINNPSLDGCPPYSEKNEYPIINDPNETSPLNPPFLVNSTAPTMPSGYPVQSTSIGHDQSGRSYQLIPENPAPAYSDVVKQPH